MGVLHVDTLAFVAVGVVACAGWCVVPDVCTWVIWVCYSCRHPAVFPFGPGLGVKCGPDGKSCCFGEWKRCPSTGVTCFSQVSVSRSVYFFSETGAGKLSSCPALNVGGELAVQAAGPSLVSPCRMGGGVRLVSPGAQVPSCSEHEHGCGQCADK